MRIRKRYQGQTGLNHLCINFGKRMKHMKYALTASNEFLLFLLSPNIVSIICQTLSHVLHFSAQRQISHVHWMRIVIKWTCRIAL